MLSLAPQYDQALVEKKWQAHWLAAKTYAWNPATARADSYVIDTPPPTVSGTLHMGHVFSYTQADFIARFQRMSGKNVFYPMGFDDNGLPTERLVEKTKKIRAVDMSREAFIAECLSVSEEARAEFRTLFQSIALSVDWDQEYHTISDDSRRLSQLSFLDLVTKGHCYRAQRPFYWDPVDQTAIASAEIEDKELPSFANDILFTCEGQPLTIMTTRPELLPACVALFCHPDDARYKPFIGKTAEVLLFGFAVPILADDTVDMEKGTGLMMCCTFGDDADILKWQKHQLPTRVVINKFSKMDFAGLPEAAQHIQAVTPSHDRAQLNDAEKRDEIVGRHDNPWALLQGKKISNTDPKHLGARQIVIDELKKAGLLVQSKPITHTVKCAERSGAPLEILPTSQWFVKVTDKKEALTQKARECNWNPDWMRLRIEQWINGLNQDWCISRQRYFGVPFPVWYAAKYNDGQPLDQWIEIHATAEDLPANPMAGPPRNFDKIETIAAFDSSESDAQRENRYQDNYSRVWVCTARNDYYKGTELIFSKGERVLVKPDFDVMDTWATSSISPQLSAGAISGSSPQRGEVGRGATHAPAAATMPPPQPSPSGEGSDDRFHKLFPADLRPQAHEIIRTWAFYTIVKAHLHNEQIPWKNLMISGWCLAEDKSKMSKSKGNVVTPVALIEERGTDAVRYWAATSRLGQDTAFSPDLLKIGKKLVGKLWNATAFAAIHLSKMDSAPTTAATDTAITETLDRWILSRLQQTVVAATDAFARYEYADALDATNQFFWADFCDNYLELIKKRVYNEDGSASQAAQQSAVRTLYYVLDGILKLYAPFVPHVTEELYAHIFADAYRDKKSLHAMGQWPKAADYPIDKEALNAGLIAEALLESIRKAKSGAQRSIKHPVEMFYVSPTPDHVEANDYMMIDSIIHDVLSAGNVRHYEWKKFPNPNAVETIFPSFAAEVILATEADAA